MLACIIGKQECRSGFYRRVLDERDRIQIVLHHGLVCCTFCRRHHPQSQKRDLSMLYMVIERFKNRDAKAVYRRFCGKGRMAPEGFAYVESGVEANFDTCFQLM